MKYNKSIAAKIVWVLLFLLVSLPSVSQEKGSLRGRVIDSSSGEAMVGVSVVIREHKIYTLTDMNGQYLLKNVPGGQQTVEYVMSGYQRSKETVSITGRSVTVNISLSYMTAGELVITGKRVSNTEAAILSKRKKAAVAQDAISAEQISKSPDSDAADAAKRVTGITIVNGDTVFIRGLGERYSSVKFAGSTIPSPNPEKRVVPLDVFPTGLIDSLVISKAWTPDMSGEFAGGVVLINPKDYPDTTIVKVSLGSSIHTNTKMNVLGLSTYGTDFYSYNGGAKDFWGYDDGDRALPGSVPSKKLNSSSGQAVAKAGRDFKNVYTPHKTDTTIPLSAAFTVGDTYKVGVSTNFGFIISGLFKESSKNTEYTIRDIDSMGQDTKKYTKKQSTYSTTSGGLISLGLSGTSQKIRLTSVYSHQSDDHASRYKGFNQDRGNGDFKKYELKYNEKNLLFNQLAGDHYIVDSLRATWNASYSIATLYQPDTRTVEFYGPEGDMPGSGNYTSRPDYIHRSFLDHEDQVYEVNPAFIVSFKQWNGLDSKFKFGGAYTYRDRESSSRDFLWDGNADLSNDPVEQHFTDDNIGSNPGEDGLVLKEIDSSSSRYNGQLTIVAGYGQFDIPLWYKFRFVGGVRYENANMNLEYWDPGLLKYRDLKKEPLEVHNILPGVSVTYSATSDINLRFATSKTLARPDFREVIEFAFPSSEEDGVMIIGNPDLKQTDIYNYDFRTEWFPSVSEIIALSFFYKRMNNPIEVLALQTGGTSVQYKYINSEYANNYGAELELRKNFSFISKSLKDLSYSVNLAYIISEIKVEDTSSQQYSSHRRPLQGQSPYVINSGISYDNSQIGNSLSLMYNICGPRIIAAGTAKTERDSSIVGGVLTTRNGDIYEEPVGKLDFVLKQKILTSGSIKFTAENLLDPLIKQTQKNETKELTSDGMIAKGDSIKYTRSQYRAGRKFGISVSYSY